MKRLVVCCDGTWNEPDRKVRGAPCPTNVVKLAALIPSDDDGVEQRVLYHKGIGSAGSFAGRLIDGATGRGITRSLVDSYKWLVRNYDPGDQIYLFGFSRGAYTARSLAGFTRNSGILRPENEDLIADALTLYRSRQAQTSPRAAASRLFRQSYAWSDLTPVHCIGVWDTVGSLGVPNTIAQGILKHLFRVNREFHDTDLSSTVRYAFHAVAIDERRWSFLPTLWTQTAAGQAAGQVLEQVWFPGYHADVGGGNSSSGLSDATLNWMIDRITYAGLKVSSTANIGPPDFSTFAPSATCEATDSMTLLYRMFPKSGVREIDTGDLARREDVSSEAIDRWNGLSSWRPNSLVSFARSNLPKSDLFRSAQK